MRIKRQGWVTARIEKIKEENVCIHIFIGEEKDISSNQRSAFKGKFLT